MLIKLIKKIPIVSLPVIVCAILACLMAFLISFRVNAKNTGDDLGQHAGSLAGKAVGSYDGLTKGWREGAEAGNEDGLSATDTTVDVSGAIRSSGNLQVLVVNGNYIDVKQIGQDYAALISQDYTAVFTIDLNNAEIELKNNVIHITLDLPTLDEASVRFVGDWEILAEYQKNKKTGDNESAMTEKDNSNEQIREKATEELKNDMHLQSSAKASAEMQIRSLIAAASLSNYEVSIEWRDN